LIIGTSRSAFRAVIIPNVEYVWVTAPANWSSKPALGPIRRVRAEVILRKRLLYAVWLAGLAAVPLGGLLLLAGIWPLGVVCLVAAPLLLWLSGQWILPWGRDATATYWSRARGAWSSWSMELEAVFAREREDGSALEEDSRRIDRAGRRVIRKLGRLRPPSLVAAEHQRLVVAIEGFNRELSAHYEERIRHAGERTRDGAVRAAQADLTAAMDALYERVMALDSWDVGRENP
jgi:hypothetical protein